MSLVQTTSECTIHSTQQVHYPFSPYQPGPIYFLTPRKCAIFGVCCEALPQQVNFLIDEGMVVNKGPDSVISYLHFFFEHYGLGETTVTLNCDNCVGQNKNKAMIWYLLWRVMHGLHKSITLHFLIAGHTKFAPDWCFGLFKQRYRRCEIDTLDDICDVVNKSTITGVNRPQLVGKEDGTELVPVYAWTGFLEPYLKRLEGISSYHHIRFEKEKLGTVIVRQYSFSEDSEKEIMLLKSPKKLPPKTGPERIPPPGLDRERQTYLFNKIRNYCLREESKDIVCPRPAVEEEEIPTKVRKVEAEE